MKTQFRFPILTPRTSLGLRPLSRLSPRHSTLPVQGPGFRCWRHLNPGSARAFARGILLALLLAGVPDWTSPPLRAELKTWQGGTLDFGDPFASIEWSRPGNWNPSGVPQNGDRLEFFDTAVPGQSAGVTTINDVPNLTVASISFGANADFQTADFLIWGNETLGVSEFIELTASTDENVSITCGLRLEGNAQFRVNWTANDSALHVGGPVDLNGHDLVLSAYQGTFDPQVIDISGSVSGTGDLLIIPPDGVGGSVRLSGSAANTSSGEVRLVSRINSIGHLVGTQLSLDKQSGPAVTGPLIIGTNCTVYLNQPHQIADSSPVTIFSGGQLKLQGNTESLGSLFLIGSDYPGPFFRKTLVDSGDATLSVAANITAYSTEADPAFVPAIQGRLGLPPGNHIIHTNSSGGSGFGATGDQLGVNPLLGPLADYGGCTLTHAPVSGSPAIDKGNSAGIVTAARLSPETAGVWHA